MLTESVHYGKGRTYMSLTDRTTYAEADDGYTNDVVFKVKTTCKLNLLITLGSVDPEAYN